MASAILRFIKFGGRSVFNVHCLYRQTFPSVERCFHLNSACYDTIQIQMPALSPTMADGTLVKWLKKEGDKLGPGDVLCDIQTDKAVVSMENEEEGILAKILVPENTKNVPIGTLIALMVEEGDDWQNVEIPKDVTPPSVETGDSRPTPSSPEAPARPVPDAHTSFMAGPSVRKLLEEYGLHAEDVPASGPHGRLLKGDVLNLVKSKNLHKVAIQSEPPPSDSAAPTPPSSPTALPPVDGEPFTDIPSSSMRKTIASRLTQSKTTIPHSYATVDCNIESVTKLRKQLAGEGIKVSVNDFIIKAAAIALQRVPQLNAIKQGDKVQMVSTTDISVAVATDNGLITPIVQNAAYLDVDQISLKIKELAKRAREGKLAPNEFQGGSFTISNLGMFGITEFSAVINPPQLAILAIGTSRIDIGEYDRPVTKMNATLSYDCSVIDETEAFRFLEVFSAVMNNPFLMVAGSHLSMNQKMDV
ncbi:pyruvate dehydrogenase protein X component, mitochondrial-like [Gigantopelta aegis]|uniref:pyruvate dehydrogenase protein X component, mitochondrial-like n=1 Tax=Gigantopelta aegis TaxID=1735272 RepID=UPI001B88AD3A|nr:pyruvate dehydrogenase protein X component, mitochondrial-like [Gigantopelta aegis]